MPIRSKTFRIPKTVEKNDYWALQCLGTKLALGIKLFSFEISWAWLALA